jgi:hypothetical protein
MRTDDGWTVDAVEREGLQWFRVLYHRFLTGGGKGKMHGLVATIDEVEQLLGESFAKLSWRRRRPASELLT